MYKDVLRLAVLLACCVLATSRFGLVGHELVGHGGAALAFGGDITDVQLFWFAGGWIRYRLATPSFTATLTIAMAGIALELVAGALLWLRARPSTLGGRLVRGTGAALVLHATWYLAAGAWNGFGDGLVLYRALGSARIAVAIAAGLLTCAAAYAGAREVLGALAATLPDSSPRRRAIGTAIALVLAGGLHGALTAGELHLRRDPTYIAVMRPERERKIAVELERWTREQASRGVPISEHERGAAQQRIARRHAPAFPFVPILAIATVASALAGARRAHPATPERITSRLLARVMGLALAAISLVIVLDLLVTM